MNFKFLILLSISAYIYCYPVYAENQKIKYYPFGNLTLCRGCGHSHSDTWRGNFRIENISDKDLVIYGYNFDGKFSPGGQIQRRNPDICEWHYGNGKSKNIEWEKQSSLGKNPFTLKAKKSIEFETHFGEFDLRQVTRFTVYIKESSKINPYEVFSEPFTLKADSVKDNNGKLLKYENFEFVKADAACDPNCKIPIEQSPNINEIKLGMTVEEFKKQFSKAIISKSKEKKYNIKWAWIWNYDADIFNASITFLDDRIVRIETQFRSLENARDKGNLYLTVAEKLGLKDFWTPYSNTFECKDFLIDILSNQNPTITIWNKSFIEVRDKINEEALKK